MSLSHIQTKNLTDCDSFWELDYTVPASPTGVKLIQTRHLIYASSHCIEEIGR